MTLRQLFVIMRLEIYISLSLSLALALSLWSTVTKAGYSVSKKNLGGKKKELQSGTCSYGEPCAREQEKTGSSLQREEEVKGRAVMTAEHYYNCEILSVRLSCLGPPNPVLVNVSIYILTLYIDSITT